MASDKDGGDQVHGLLTAASQLDSTLFVLASGFDPRCVTGLIRFVEAVGCPHVLALDPQRVQASDDELNKQRRQENLVRIEKLAGCYLQRLEYPLVQDEASAGRLLANELTSAKYLSGIRTVVVDISAFPTSMLFPCLRGLLELSGGGDGPSQLLVLVTENATLDQEIVKGNLGQAHVLAGFGKKVRMVRSPEPIRVWAPILGRGAGAAMRLIAEAIDPQEVCPVVPFPATDPRLADSLLLEHRELLIEERRVQPGNLVYAAQANPFDLYRTLVNMSRDYERTLSPVGGAVVALSSHGSKLLSIGALLAAYEEDLPVYGVRANRYSLNPENYETASRQSDSVACLWLRGEPYSAV